MVHVGGLWPPISCMNGGKFQRWNEDSSLSDQFERSKEVLIKIHIRVYV